MRRKVSKVACITILYRILIRRNINGENDGKNQGFPEMDDDRSSPSGNCTGSVQ
jgi:hypothetical protein